MIKIVVFSGVFSLNCKLESGRDISIWSCEISKKWSVHFKQIVIINFILDSLLDISKM